MADFDDVKNYNDHTDTTALVASTVAGGALVGHDAPLPTVPQSVGVPTTFTAMSQVSEQFPVVKGNLNKLRLRPQIQNEHCESSREAMGTVDSATAVGQMFKASQPNINGISLTLESAATFASMDAIVAGGGEKKAGTMEYSGDAALQTEWVKSGADEATRSAFTDGTGATQDGSYAIKMDLSGVVADEWRVTVTSTDLTGVTFRLRFSQDISFLQAGMFFFISDGTNGKSILLPVSSADEWQTFTFAEESMIIDGDDDGGAAVDITAITKFGFRIDNRTQQVNFAYADSITYQAVPGSVNLELWDMGATLPASNGTVDYTSKTQYAELGDRGIGGSVRSEITLALAGGKQKYHVDDFIAGVATEIPANTVLTENNYYAIVLKYVDTDVTVYGPDTTFSIDYYSSGYAWTAEVADGLIDLIAGAAGSGTYSDLMFQVFSTQVVYVTDIQLLTVSAPGNAANVSIFIEDSNMNITAIPLTNQAGGMNRTVLDTNLELRPPIVGIGGKIEAYYNDDPTDSVAVILMTATYLCLPEAANG